jgi:hypothetical protein
MLEKGVYVCLAGGLGNQLFMYAAGKALAYRNKTKLFLDTKSGFEDDLRYQRKYSLDIFNVNFQHFQMCNFADTRVKRLINKFGPMQYRNVLLEKKVKSLQGVHVNRAIELRGYWQSEDHFKGQWQHLSSELDTDGMHLSVESARILEKIQSSKTSVAVHFRTINYRHILPADYYSRAFDHLNSHFAGAHYMIFADSHKGINLEPFSGLNHTVVRTDDHREDFFLMSSCSHQILANSTYSWWAAYLNKNSDKKILAPKRWGFKIETPPSWQLV